MLSCAFTLFLITVDDWRPVAFYAGPTAQQDCQRDERRLNAPIPRKRGVISPTYDCHDYGC